METIKKLPPMYFTNITGGEPFIREDLKDIVRELYKKATELLFQPTAFLPTELLALQGVPECRHQNFH